MKFKKQDLKEQRSEKMCKVKDIETKQLLYIKAILDIYLQSVAF